MKSLAFFCKCKKSRCLFRYLLKITFFLESTKNFSFLLQDKKNLDFKLEKKLTSLTTVPHDREVESDLDADPSQVCSLYAAGWGPRKDKEGEDGGRARTSIQVENLHSSALAPYPARMARRAEKNMLVARPSLRSVR